MSVPADAPILTAKAMREAEAACAIQGTSLTELMELAGAAVADTAWRMAAGAPILILCGPGNNGGDGYVAARLLAARGAAVRVAALAEPATDLAKAARAGWSGPVEPLNGRLASAPLIVDALFGVGLSRPIPDGLAIILRHFSDRRILAVDLPSGVESDGAEDWMPPLAADVTLALGALKPAHVLLPTAPGCGRVLLAPIGISASKAMRSLPAPQTAKPDVTAHKFTRGMVLVFAGPMRGAAGLTAAAALRAGAGYVVLDGAQRAPLSAIITESDEKFGERLDDPRVGAVVIGPGFPAGDELLFDVEAALDSGKPLVLDAAAIDAALPRLSETPRKAILTPHEGEFARAFPQLYGSKIDRAKAAAVRTQAVVIYKGADTIVAAPDGRVAAAWPGSPWLATAGTGDVLAGACGAMLARGGDAFDAAVAAVGWHIAQAARIGPGLVADDLVRE
ncbi:bifunctional ADP-dependent (S)-NAD(P)H-hydrate dehydratase/NAD(P)H-hydrate epimerase [Sphingopyxis sp. H038]|uniref:bifunctional ADP-dependent NAD(P)H-hydrate dehydratase/NAD(P)H-hydrate epimerase n=1 Tax=unclassified Sphingopyxis TaxID=2614943 RepID=UPI0007316860|nr:MULTISPECIES: bifunctional ADP-dependent NAD(P)H-hydrate dehydratase/NAD(P)H-hydrate epimerase [unclassified Sphingopyxis]KTE02197.1 bifunctional ADP-dependent (S)-NAD(P)H-hydrate dehydratase/NAD(P)H-hydrate epimerase [Sphingopyxis sp. H012]KTE09945.1 bifunctional ADP-dependent (S)-NAD(P)H-hydrate dehydratase/NAD(P)H-hydrate epimerase [Sphingopyxis sp. H053]KTE15342.1 bifunctional ADP-dependent (S)-NAD(P)H-hydrate dehydratase/NAD(P)H-hydrate epimerase [Sphingopyxis sp. H093]KTE26173.1 bifunc